MRLQKMRDYFFTISTLAVLLAVPLFTQAHGIYVGDIPNGGVFSCATCHIDPQGGGTRTQFGQDFKDNDKTWDPVLAMKNSDGDGATNGEELLDPNGTWTTSDPDPGNPADVTNPGVADVVAATPTPTATPTSTPTPTPVASLTPIPTPTPPPGSLVFYSFDNDSNSGWDPPTQIGTFELLTSSSMGDTIEMSANGAFLGLGWWTSPVIDMTPFLSGMDGQFKARFRIRTDNTIPDQFPNMRLRATTAGDQIIALKSFVSVGSGAYMPTTSPQDFYLDFDVPASDPNVRLFVDLVAFDPFDNLNATIYIEEVSIEPR